MPAALIAVVLLSGCGKPVVRHERTVEFTIKRGANDVVITCVETTRTAKKHSSKSFSGETGSWQMEVIAKYDEEFKMSIGSEDQTGVMTDGVVLCGVISRDGATDVIRRTEVNPSTWQTKP